MKKIKNKLSKTEINFEPIIQDGRCKAEVFYLFLPEEAESSSAALIKYHPGGEAPLHRHISFELIYILDGEMITAEGTFRKNDLILFKPGSIHYSKTKKGCLVLVIWYKQVEQI